MKFVMVGNAQVGKTAFRKRLHDGYFVERYEPTLGVHVQRIHTNRVVDLWDCAGQEKLSGMKDAYYIESDACIIMMDTTTPNSDVEKWYDGVKRECGDIPFVVICNKMDNQNEPESTYTFDDGVCVPLFYLSMKTSSDDELGEPFEAFFN